MNKNGWGLRVELAFLLLFLVCILIATIGLNRLGLLSDKDSAYIDLGSSNVGSFDYESLEKRVVEASKKYYNDYYPNGSSDTVIISVSTLKNNGYISPLYDSRNKECKGYAKVLGTKNAVAYIKCSVYKTAGYSEEDE